MIKMAKKDEQVGFHKGSITTLVKERDELMKLLRIVDTLLRAHVEALKKLGVDITKEAKTLETKAKKKK